MINLGLNNVQVTAAVKLLAVQTQKRIVFCLNLPYANDKSCIDKLLFNAKKTIFTMSSTADSLYKKTNMANVKNKFVFHPFLYITLFFIHPTCAKCLYSRANMTRFRGFYINCSLFLDEC